MRAKLLWSAVRSVGIATLKKAHEPVRCGDNSAKTYAGGTLGLSDDQLGFGN